MAFDWLNTFLLRRFYRTQTPPPDTLPSEHTGPEYRLLKWPELPDALHTAEVMGALSVMSNRPVTAYWFAHRVKWRTWRAIEFLEGLCLSGDARHCEVAAGAQLSRAEPGISPAKSPPHSASPPPAR